MISERDAVKLAGIADVAGWSREICGDEVIERDKCNAHEDLKRATGSKTPVRSRVTQVRMRFGRRIHEAVAQGTTVECFLQHRSVS